MENGRFYGKLNFGIEASISGFDEDSIDRNCNVFSHRTPI